MNKRQKILTVLLTPFVLGFFLGLLVGGGCSRSERRESRRARSETIRTEEAEAALSRTGEADDDVDGTGTPQRREIIYYTKRMAYAQVFNDVN